MKHVKQKFNQKNTKKLENEKKKHFFKNILTEGKKKIQFWVA